MLTTARADEKDAHARESTSRTCGRARGAAARARAAGDVHPERPRTSAVGRPCRSGVVVRVAARAPRPAPRRCRRSSRGPPAPPRRTRRSRPPPQAASGPRASRATRAGSRTPVRSGGSRTGGPGSPRSRTRRAAGTGRRAGSRRTPRGRRASSAPGSDPVDTHRKRSATRSSQPQRRSRPVTVPNSPPISRTRSCAGPSISLGNGPSPTRVTYAFETPTTSSIRCGPMPKLTAAPAAIGLDDVTNGYVPWSRSRSVPARPRRARAGPASARSTSSDVSAT